MKKNEITILIDVPKHIFTELLKTYEDTDFTLEQIFKNMIAIHIQEKRERKNNKK